MFENIIGHSQEMLEILQQARQGGTRDLKTDVLTHLARVGWLAGHGRRKG